MEAYSAYPNARKAIHSSSFTTDGTFQSSSLLPVWEYLTRTDGCHDRSVEYSVYGWRLNDVSNVPSGRICCYTSDIHSCVDLGGRAYGAAKRREVSFIFKPSTENDSSYFQLGETFAVVRTEITLEFIRLTWVTVDMVLKVLSKSPTRWKAFCAEHRDHLPNNHGRSYHICYISILFCRFSGDYWGCPILRYPNVVEPCEFSDRRSLLPWRNNTDMEST